MAAICPSIMADGATMSAPAFTCESAVSASTSSVASFCTCPFSIMPQWPWLVYSHRQTSVITSMSGTSFLTRFTACWTMPSLANAPVPCSSFFAGMPKSRSAGMPIA